MNKKILISLSVIGVVAAIGIGGTIAYFSDTETSTGNTFSTGTIDIKIDGQNPWTQSWDIVDMKPCETGYITFNIQNPGDNPVNVWKTIKNITTSDGDITEPECVYGGGVWDSNSQQCDVTDPDYTPQSNLQGWINYDLSVNVPIASNSDNWHQTIFKDENNVKITAIWGQPIFLGMIPAGRSMTVTQSYHLVPETQNWAQADTMTFDIEIYAEQLTGSLVLENKTGDPDWQIIADNKTATLTYNLTSPTFDYSLAGKVPLSNTKYCLIYYADPWAGNNPGALIGCGTSVNKNISFSGSVELGMDLPQSSSDQNFPEGAKIWLVTASDYNSGTESTGPMTTWSPANYLFETGLITYDDTDI